MQFSRFIYLKALQLNINKMPKKKIKNGKIILAVSYDSAFKIPLEITFKKLGFQVLVFDYRKSSLAEKFIFIISLLMTSMKNKKIEMRNRRLINLINKTK